MIQDFLSQSIVPGAYISYGVGKGDICIAKVLAAKVTPKTYPHGATYDHYAIKVRSLYRLYDGTLQLSLRASSLSFPGRMVVLQEIPPNIKRIYADAGL